MDFIDQEYKCKGKGEQTILSARPFWSTIYEYYGNNSYANENH